MNHIHLLSLKPAAAKYTEPCGKGLHLIVYPSGRKVWSFHGRISGKVITKTLGDFPEVGEKAARAFIAALTTTKESPKTEDILKKVLDLKVANGRLMSKHAAKGLRRFALHLPALCIMRIDEITAPIARAHLDPVAQKSHKTAQKMIQMLRECETYAVNAGIKDNYCLQGLTKVYTSITANVTHRTSCPPADFDKVLTIAKGKHKDMIMFGVYSLLRVSEIVAARAEWINRNTMSIDIPAEHMKMKRPHRVPITPQIAELLERLPKDGYLFPTTRASASGHLTDVFYRNLFDPVKDICVPHGVRSVGRTWMSDNKVPFDVAEECLAHVRGNAVSRSYDRSDLLEERREVMARWCAFVDEKLPKKTSDTGGEEVDQAQKAE